MRFYRTRTAHRAHQGIRASWHQPNMVREDHAVTSPQVGVTCWWRCCAPIGRDHNSTATSNPALEPRPRKYYAAAIKAIDKLRPETRRGSGASSIERQAPEGLSRAITFRGEPCSRPPTNVPFERGSGRADSLHGTENTIYCINEYRTRTRTDSRVRPVGR